MGKGKLKIDPEQMVVKAENLETALEDYQEFGTNPFSQQIGDLEEMNTDFLARFVTMLDDVDSANPNLSECILEITGLTKGIAGTLDGIDVDDAGKISFKRKEK